MSWLILADEATAAARAAALAGDLGIPDGEGTTAYAVPVALADGTFALAVDADALAHLTEPEAAALVASIAALLPETGP